MPNPSATTTVARLVLRFDDRYKRRCTARCGEVSDVGGNRLPLGSCCDSLQDFGALKPYFRDEVMRSSGSVRSGCRSCNLDLFYFLDRVHQRHVLLKIVLIEFLDAFWLSIQDRDFCFGRERRRRSKNARCYCC